MTGSKKTTGGKPISTPMESYAINLVLPKLQNGTKWNVNSLQLEIMIFALILGLLRGMLGRSFLLELPPRARRIRVLDSDPGTGYGTTSACAENTKSERMSDAPPRNYLRVRGEYSGIRQWACTQAELPPRARRILIHGFRVVTDSGTTSACAENTDHDSVGLFQQRNYLRVRGEYGSNALMGTYIVELPPRARRIRCGLWCFCRFRGTTSACAENTFPLGFGLPSARNYLRVRGEYDAQALSSQAALELPPRARRIPKPRCSNNTVHGTTSACAENTFLVTGSLGSIRNYLRVRGEY